MRRFFGFATTLWIALAITVPVAQAQLRLVAQNAVLSTITITPTDPTTFATTESGEIFALDVPPIPSSGYVQFTSSAVWELDFTGEAPVRASFQLVFNVTSPALPSDIVLKFGVPLTRFRNPNGAGGLQAGTGVDSEVFTRKLLADFLVAENPSLTKVAATQIVDLMFVHGFHVSVSAQLKSLNVADSGIFNPNVAFFAQPGSVE